MESRNAREKSAGREQKLHGLVCMCLPIPPIQEFKEFNQLSDCEFVERVKRERFALTRYGGASRPAPRSTFRLRKGRIRETRRISLRVSLGCRWKCWLYPQSQVGVVNRWSGIRSNRIPLIRLGRRRSSSGNRNCRRPDLHVSAHTQTLATPNC